MMSRFYFLLKAYFKNSVIFRKKALLLFKQGNANYIKRNSTQAITNFSKAIEFYSKFTMAYFGRANAKFSLKDYSGAIADFTKVIEFSPNFAESFFNRGDAKYRLGDYSGAISDFTRFIEINPMNDRSYYANGVANFGLYDSSGAIVDYTNFIFHYKDGLRYSVTSDFPNCFGGDLKFGIRDFEAAIDDFTSFLIWVNNSSTIQITGTPYVNLERGEARFNLCDYTGPVPSFIKFVEISLTFREVYFKRGMSKKILEDYLGAIEDFTIAIKIDPYNKKACESREESKLNIGLIDTEKKDFKKNKRTSIQSIFEEANESSYPYNNSIDYLKNCYAELLNSNF